ncbi:PAS domain-containing protein [Desulfogranum japonicum]|uniref:PAS domain-containing protein n=1 Tax=Desulfogranum japonicum TaxID=231447 RepID=UPI0004041D38|nr:PAS domain-containing protein [Desulfogranum japonicum]
MTNYIRIIDTDLAVHVLEHLPTPVMAVNREMELVFLNEAGLKHIGRSWEEVKGKPCKDILQSRHCGTSECKMRQVMDGGQVATVRNEMKINGRTVPVEYTAAALKDQDGTIVGGVEYIIDITERVRQEKKLQEQSKTIREISTPAIKLWDRMVILPVVGVVDSQRAQQMMSAMLQKIMATAAKVIILDIQGVAAMDTAVANHLIKIAKATKLMGCRCIISGITPAVAETLVQLGIELTDIDTNSTLQDSLFDAFSLLDLTVTPKGSKQ